MKIQLSRTRKLCVLFKPEKLSAWAGETDRPLIGVFLGASSDADHDGGTRSYTLDYLKALLKELGKGAEARPMYEQALEGYEATLGPHHHLTLCSADAASRERARSVALCSGGSTSVASAERTAGSSCEHRCGQRCEQSCAILWVCPLCLL